MKILRTKPKFKSMNFKYYNFYYTVFKNRDDEETVNDDYEFDYIFFTIIQLLIIILE